jgi:hypothetical protein
MANEKTPTSGNWTTDANWLTPQTSGQWIEPGITLQLPSSTTNAGSLATPTTTTTPAATPVVSTAIPQSITNYLDQFYAQNTPTAPTNAALNQILSNIDPATLLQMLSQFGYSGAGAPGATPQTGNPYAAAMVPLPSTVTATTKPTSSTAPAAGLTSASTASVANPYDYSSLVPLPTATAPDYSTQLAAQNKKNNSDMQSWLQSLGAGSGLSF